MTSYPIKFQKKNITQALSKEVGEVLLNPSIAHWKNDLFLCSYRIYIRYQGLDTKQYEEDPITNPNHPWLGGEGATTGWQSPTGYDETRIVLLQLQGNRVRVVHTYGTIPGVDIRLFQYDRNMFVATGNVWVKSQETKLKNTDCEKGCMLMLVRTIQIEGGDRLNISRGTALCPKKAERIEKNWTIWKSPEGALMASYGITPRHEVFRLRLEEDQVTCPRISPIVGKNNFFKRLSDYYKNACPGYFPWCGSTSTPALRRRNGNYLAVGHFKYIYQGAENDIKKNTPLHKFNQKLFEKGKKFHPKFVYLMFLYEFSYEEPYSILRVSNMFMPESRFSLVFASGLAFSPRHNKYIISYGDHDSECWLLFMSNDEIDQALMETLNPAKIQFLLI